VIMNPFNLFAKTRFGSWLIREFGKIDTSEYEDLDGIAKKRGLSEYTRLYYDEQVKFCFTIKKFLILSGGFEVLPAREGDRDAREKRDFIVDCLENTERSFTSILFSMLSALDYGYSVSELIFVPDGSRFRLKNIKTKFPQDFSFQYDEYGNLIALLCLEEEVPLEKFVVYSYMSRFGQYEGESDLKAVYNPVWTKDKLIKFWLRYLERYGAPIVKGSVPKDAKKDEIEKFENAMKRIHNITAITLPQSEDGRGFDFELVEPKREGGSQFKEAVDKADERIARGALIPSLFGAQKVGYGSYALGELQFDVVYQFLKAIGDNFADEAINRQVIRRLIDINFGGGNYPIFRIKPIVKEFVESYRKTIQGAN